MVIRLNHLNRITFHSDRDNGGKAREPGAPHLLRPVGDGEEGMELVG